MLPCSPVFPLVLHLRVAEATSEHAQCLDWEDEFVVGVGDHAMKC
jgi:hypothetical protein